jgi:hypothetical protein
LNLPKETAVLKLPKNELEWKEKTRKIEKGYWLVERMPADQSPKYWSDSIAIQIIKRNDMNKRTITIERAADIIKENLVNQYPGLRMRWGQFRISDSELYYEWIMDPKIKAVPSQHTIARVFLTDEGFHRIGIKRRFGKLSEDERMKWFGVLENDVSMESLCDAHAMKPAISIW